MKQRSDPTDSAKQSEEFSTRLGELLLRRGDRIAVAESLTAGVVQSSIAAVSGASRYFLGGITAYHLDAKVDLLGVDRAEAERTDCVSAEVARQMARGVQRAFRSEVAAGTTGYADGVEIPFAYVAVVVGDTETIDRLEGAGLTRRQMQWRVALRVLELTIDMLEASHGV